MQSMEHLYQVVSDRREYPQEKSYTCYLFEQGLDKICKKIGEESAEVIIAANASGSGARKPKKNGSSWLIKPHTAANAAISPPIATGERCG